MYTYLYVNIHICIHTHTHIHIYVCMYVCACVCMCVLTHSEALLCPGVCRYLPASQAIYVPACVAPSSNEYFLATQLVQGLDPVTSL